MEQADVNPTGTLSGACWGLVSRSSDGPTYPPYQPRAAKSIFARGVARIIRLTRHLTQTLTGSFRLANRNRGDHPTKASSGR